MKDSVVITGTGMVSSLGLSARETWEALLSNTSGIKPVEDFTGEGSDCIPAAQVHGLSPEDLGIHPRDSRIMDRHAYMLMKSSRDAFKEARLDDGSVAPGDIGYFAGMGMVDYAIEDLLPSVVQSRDADGGLDYDAFYTHAYQQIHPLWPLSMLNNISFCQVAIDLGITGENTTFSPHADSAVDGIIEACSTLQEKKTKAVLAGGVSEKVSPLSLARAMWFGMVNTSSSAHKALCRPFGKDRRGTVLGEGCGILAMELQSRAKDRNVPALAAVTGYGTSFEPSNESPCPTAEAISLAMKHAIASAGLDPYDIDLLIAHGDGTGSGDKNEIEAIHRTFPASPERMRVFSSKGALGHMLAGSPAVDVILGVYMMKNGIIPATLNSSPLDESIRFTVVSGSHLKTHPRRVLINSLSYEGQCASLILEAVG